MAKSTKTTLKGMCERLCEKASEERAMEKKKESENSKSRVRLKNKEDECKLPEYKCKRERRKTLGWQVREFVVCMEINTEERELKAIKVNTKVNRWEKHKNQQNKQMKPHIKPRGERV